MQTEILRSLYVAFVLLKQLASKHQAYQASFSELLFGVEPLQVVASTFFYTDAVMYIILRVKLLWLEEQNGILKVKMVAKDFLYVFFCIVSRYTIATLSILTQPYSEFCFFPNLRTSVLSVLFLESKDTMICY